MKLFPQVCTSKIEDLYSNVVGNGLCGYLCLCQAILGDKRKLKMKNAKDRIEVKKLLRECFLPDIKKEYQELIRRVIGELEELGDNDLEREPWWPPSTGLWLQTGF